MTYSLLAVLSFAVTSIVLMLWMSRFRRRADWSQLGSKQGIGSRSPSMTWMSFLDRNSFEPRGQRLVPWLGLSFFLLVVTIGVAIFQFPIRHEFLGLSLTLEQGRMAVALLAISFFAGIVHWGIVAHVSRIRDDENITRRLFHLA